MIRVVQVMRRRIGQEIQRLAPRMVIQHQVGGGHQDRRQVIRDLLRDRTVGAPRKGAVHVHPVDGADPRARRDRGRVHRGQDDHAAHHLRGLQLPCQLLQRQGAFVFVAVIAPGQQRGGPVAAADHRQRDHHAAPGAVVAAVGQAQKAVMLTRRVQRDGGRDRRHDFTSIRRGRVQNRSGAPSVMMIDSVVSYPQSSIHSPVMK